MATVVISPAFQVRLPKSAREALQLVPGQQLRVVQYAGRLELVPVRPTLAGAALFGDPLASLESERLPSCDATARPDTPGLRREDKPP